MKYRERRRRRPQSFTPYQSPATAIVVRHDSLASFVREAQGAGPGRACHGPDSEWVVKGGCTFEGAVKLASLGWPEGVREAGTVATRIADRVVTATGLTEVSTGSWDVTGSSYDVGEYLSGTPECWYNVETNYSRKLVRIVANLSISGGVSEETFRKRGIAVGALVMALTSRGYPVTVDAVVCMDSHSDFIRLHDGALGGPMDLDRIIYGLGHPTVFRRIHHRLRSGNGPSCRWCPSSVYSEKGQDEADLFIGGAHLAQVERWEDGGAEWVLSEYLKQTGGA